LKFPEEERAKGSVLFDLQRIGQLLHLIVPLGTPHGKTTADFQ